MMENRRLKKLKDNYFDGSSSLEEEKELKKSDDVFFQTLNQEKNVRMDWTFEDFTSQVHKENKVLTFWWNRVWLKYAVAAILLAIAGAALYINQTQSISTKPALVQQRVPDKITAPSESTQKTVAVTESNQDNVGVAQQRLAMLPHRPSKVVNQHKRAKTFSNKKENKKDMPAIEVTDYRADYVVLNGKPVASEEEAVELTLKSLGLLATNLENSVDKAMQIKQMSITIN
jgi:hypothetical protein